MELLDEVLIGRRIIYTKVDFAPIVFARGLTGKEKIISLIKYNEAKKEAEEIGLNNKEDLIVNLSKSGDWTAAHDNQLEKLSKEIDYVSSEVKINEFNLGRKNILKKRLARVKSAHDDLQQTKDILFLNCIEQYAETYRYLWNIQNIITHVDGSPVWKTTSDFESCDIDIVKELVHSYNKYFILTEQQVRKIARSGMWRILYNSVSSTTELFNKPVCDFDINQINLIYWTTVYNNVVECAEPPTDDIINNDSEFDVWSKAYSEKNRKEKAKNNIAGNKKSSDLSETFIMTDEAGADKLYKEVGSPEIKFKK